MLNIRNIKKERICAFIFVLILILNNNFFFSIQPIYYGTVIITWIFLFTKDILLKSMKVSSLFLFYIICILSIIVNDIPEIVQPYQRFFIFFMMSSLLGPVFSSYKLNNFREKVFYYINDINIIICTLSFILWVLGIHSGQKMNEKYGVLRPDFAGLYNHSMTLGPMAAIGVIYSFYQYFSKKKSKTKYLYILLLIFCFFSTIKAGSRNAILALVICFPFYYFKISEHKVSKLFIFISVMILILVLTFPLYQSSLTFLLSKFNNSQASGSITSTRNSKWLARLTEFIDNPFFGVGYSNTTIEKIGEGGVVEPGTSWLAILSMTGIFGFSIFILNYFKIFIMKIYLKKQNNQIYYVLSVMLFLSIYMIFEGVLLAAGTLMSAFIWLTFGVLKNQKFNL